MVRYRRSLIGLVVYLVLFIFLYAPGVAHIVLPDMRGFIGGLLDGIFMLPIFLLEVWNKFIHHFGGVPAMFRMPNHGLSYNFGYLIGAMLLWSSIVIVVPMRRVRRVRS